MADSEVKKIYSEILTRINKIYQQYEKTSSKMKEQNNKKYGAIVDKAQSQLLNNIEMKLQLQLGKLVTEMEKIQVLKGKYAGEVRNCHNSIKNILKKKPFNFKVIKQLSQLYERTYKTIQDIRKKLPGADKTAFLCCGVDGMKQMQRVMQPFRIQAARWQMIQILEAKGSVDNFICPEFRQEQYNFIRTLLLNNWPKQKQPVIKYETKQVVKTVQKIVNKQGYNPLDQANQFIFGINKEQNLFRGLQIYQKQADKNNNSQACAFLGKVYQQGILLPKNLPKAVEYYKKSMQSQHSYGGYRFALCLVKGQMNKNGQNANDLQKGFELLTKISQSKNPCPEALAELAYVYEHGKFSYDGQGLFKVNVDLKKALTLNQKAKSMHLARAVNNLGLLYYDNKQVNLMNPKQKNESELLMKQNIKKSKQYFLQAQKLGYPQSYYNLGTILKSQRQNQRALKYFYQGSLKNDHESKIKFAYELINQTSIQKQQFQDHYLLAKRWLQQVVQYINTIDDVHNKKENVPSKLSIQKGQALYYLGLFYEHGFGVDKSPKRAINLYLKASEVNYAPARNKMGDCYFSGFGIPINRQLAIGCYVQAAELGNSDAMVNLGTIYMNGIPGLIQRNYNKAHEFFVQAMNHQNSDANIHLSYMYRNGFGIQQDQQLSKKLLEQAAAQKNSTALYMLKQTGQEFNRRVYYDNLDVEFFEAPRRINISQIVPTISGIN